MNKVAIIGSGCAGLTAGIYSARANLSPIIYAGNLPGGQLSTTTDVENYPGFPEGIMGPELISRMTKQVQRFGAKVIYEKVEKIIETTQNKFTINPDSKKSQAFDSIIIASGSSPRHLGLENEKKLIGSGLTTCATCDGAFYRDVPVCVVGGGDSACEEATFLTRFASKVYLIHRRDELRASQIMSERAQNNDKIEIIWDSIVTDYITENSTGKEKMTAINIKNVKTDKTTKLDVKCVFLAIGHIPNTDFASDLIELDDEKFIKVQNSTATSKKGIFAAGDVVDKKYMQAVTAAGHGCMAALDVEHYLSK